MDGAAVDIQNDMISVVDILMYHNYSPISYVIPDVTGNILYDKNSPYNHTTVGVSLKTPDCPKSCH